MASESPTLQFADTGDVGFGNIIYLLIQAIVKWVCLFGKNNIEFSVFLSSMKKLLKKAILSFKRK